MSLYIISDYLEIIKTPNNYNVYHTLLGNLNTLNKDSINLLNYFKNETTIEAILLLYKPEEEEEIRDYFNLFIELSYIKKIGFDERNIIKEIIESRISKLEVGGYLGGIQLNVTNSCNFNCHYCFVDSTEERRGRDNPLISKTGGSFMNFETAKFSIERIIDVIKSNNNNELVIKFFGREPLINWKTIKEIMRYFKKGESHDMYIAYTITTNGSLINEEVAKVFSDYNMVANVSIDGTKKSNNAIRTQKKDSGGTFDSIKKGLDYLYKYNVNTSLSAVMTEDNFNDLDTDFVDFAKDYKCKSVQLLLGMQDNYLDSITPQKIVDKLFKIYSYGIKNNISVLGYWHNAFAQLFNTEYKNSTKKMKRIMDSCTATGFQISIEPNGDIYPCKAMSLYLGNINNIEKVFKSQAYFDVQMRTYGNVDECKNCEIEGFCQGVCLGNIEEKYNNIYRVDPAFCNIYKKITRKIVKNI